VSKCCNSRGVQCKNEFRIRVVSDKVDNVSRDAENKINTLNNPIESVCECMDERMNANVVQARKERV